ncbi:hypothetical protein Glove_200g3 [Diversispora epigaea]|uniref:Uncharacterized protein n=1 Tax=Diversispora epigaea TaxID=1348612 RepID=A0A397IPP1_9GLOM|nr:hypothetical protein Glove_200g3 [Diversispora epigaea]
MSLTSFIGNLLLQPTSSDSSSGVEWTASRNERTRKRFLEIDTLDENDLKHDENISKKICQSTNVLLTHVKLFFHCVFISSCAVNLLFLSFKPWTIAKKRSCLQLIFFAEIPNPKSQIIISIFCRNPKSQIPNTSNLCILASQIPNYLGFGQHVEWTASRNERTRKRFLEIDTLDENDLKHDENISKKICQSTNVLLTHIKRKNYAENTSADELDSDHPEEKIIVNNKNNTLWFRLKIIFSMFNLKFSQDESNSGISSVCDERENSSDVNSDEEFLEDLNTTDEDTSPIIEKLLEYGESIARYRIEEKIVGSFSVVIPKNIQDLLTKYNKAIKENTINFKSNVSKIALVINENPFDKERTGITCFQMPNDFFHDSRLSEYAYRDRIINKLWEDVFLDVYPAICMRTGEIENIDQKNQKDHVQVGFGEVVGNPCRHDDEKRDGDRGKMLKAMQISLNKLRSLLSEKGISNEDLENLETFGNIWHACVYFTIPDTADRLSDLSSIIHVMLKFKYHIINLKNHIDSLLKHKPVSFEYRKTISKPAVDCSFLMKSPKKNTAEGKQNDRN